MSENDPVRELTAERCAQHDREAVVTGRSRAATPLGRLSIGDGPVDPRHDGALDRYGKPRCMGTSKQRGERCTRGAVPGATVCYYHGGAAPQVARAALRLVVEAKATRDLAELGYEPVADPIAELFDLAGRFKALESSFAVRVAELGDELRYEGKGPVGTEQLRAEVAMWERFLDRLAKILEVLARLNLDERMVRISEGQATLIGKVIEGVLDALDLSAEVRARAAEELPRQLRAVSG